ncbi:hypothetical protein [Deinococcus multiflagellatus]|uniref:Uncharacterized protein n=1 Tax=Deinococcus multiflagellatus TaxID=1656887 RepID=A0ABW1ZIJ9_9DEIO|nr:hypothetical protein [Deinococcus multiflagellatus]MBZ9712017.1 hypothetical protein [Deinococcus multiflagellatus]
MFRLSFWTADEVRHLASQLQVVGPQGPDRPEDLDVLPNVQLALAAALERQTGLLMLVC